VSVYHCFTCDETRDSDECPELEVEGVSMCSECEPDHRPECAACNGTGIGDVYESRCSACKGRGSLPSRAQRERLDYESEQPRMGAQI